MLKNVKFIDGVSTYALGNLGSNVTPWKSGHFPFIAYSMVKRGFTIEESLSVMARNQFIYSVSLPFLYFGLMIYAIVANATVTIGDYTIPLFIFSLIGMVLNILYVVVLMLVLYFRRFQDLICCIELKIFLKLKIVKDEVKWLNDKQMKLNIYKETADKFWQQFYKNIPSFLIYYLFMFLLNGFPYITYVLISNVGFSFSDFFFYVMLFQAMSYVTNILPVPGGMIAVEFSFLTVFEPYMGQFVNISLLIYRFFTFILLIVYDFIIFLVFQIFLIKKDKDKLNAVKEEQ